MLLWESSCHFNERSNPRNFHRSSCSSLHTLSAVLWELYCNVLRINYSVMWCSCGADSAWASANRGTFTSLYIMLSVWAHGAAEVSIGWWTLQRVYTGSLWGWWWWEGLRKTWHAERRTGSRAEREGAHGSPGVCEVFVFSSCSLCLWFYMSCVRCTTAQPGGETLFLACVCVCVCVGNWLITDLESCQVRRKRWGSAQL